LHVPPIYVALVSFAEIAETLNREGWRPAKRRNTFNAPMVHHSLITAGAIEPKYRRRKPQIERRPNEWTIRELAEQIGVPDNLVQLRPERPPAQPRCEGRSHHTGLSRSGCHCRTEGYTS
jgi:hypothetical protein